MKDEIAKKRGRRCKESERRKRKRDSKSTVDVGKTRKRGTDRERGKAGNWLKKRIEVCNEG